MSRNIIFKSWLYAAHVSEVPNPGDYVLFEVGEDSVVIVRDREGEIHEGFFIAHDGILDRVDGVMFAAPVLYYYAVLLLVA